MAMDMLLHSIRYPHLHIICSQSMDVMAGRVRSILDMGRHLENYLGNLGKSRILVDRGQVSWANLIYDGGTFTCRVDREFMKI
jgi:hypothetical protein